MDIYYEDDSTKNCYCRAGDFYVKGFSILCNTFLLLGMPVKTLNVSNLDTVKQKVLVLGFKFLYSLISSALASVPMIRLR